jgi:hypothetical protein
MSDVKLASMPGEILGQNVCKLTSKEKCNLTSLERMTADRPGNVLNFTEVDLKNAQSTSLKRMSSYSCKDILPDGLAAILGLAVDLKVLKGSWRVEEGTVGEELMGEAGLTDLQVGDPRREGAGPLHHQQEQDEETAQQQAPHPARGHPTG